jgi:hypothetical protein
MGGVARACSTGPERRRLRRLPGACCPASWGGDRDRRCSSHPRATGGGRLDRQGWRPCAPDRARPRRARRRAGRRTPLQARAFLCPRWRPRRWETRGACWARL